MTIYTTVAELKAALADMPDDMLLARRAQFEGWSLGVDSGILEVQTLGSGNDQMLVSTSNEFWQKMKTKERGKPFTVIVFD